MGYLARALSALTLAAGLALSTPAAASTILTFDDDDVNGGGFLAVNPGAAVVDLAGHGKALYIPTIGGPAPYTNFAALFSATPTIVDIGGDPFLRKANLLRIEVLPNIDTPLEVQFGLFTATDPMTAGHWYEIDFYGNAPMTEGWRIRADGGFHIDNIEVDWIYEPLFTAVPEPGTWALMIVGFGLAGAALRRRAYAAS